MAILITKADLKTNIYSEVVDEITRGDNAIAQEAIDAGIAEAMGYLNRFDLDALFGTASADATVSDANLRSKVKDLIRMQLVNLGSPSIDSQWALTQYENAIRLYFRDIQAGKITPRGWPYHNTLTDPVPPQGNKVTMTSNPKRTNHL